MNPMKIAWVPPHGTINRASYRLEAYYPHLWLSQHSFESAILETFPTPEDKSKYDLLIWFRTDHPEKAFESGIPFIYFLTDGPQPSVEQMAQALWLVTDCDFIVDDFQKRKLDRLLDKLTYIPDTFDPPPDGGENPFRLVKEEKLHPKLVWIGSQGGYQWAKPTIDHLKKRWEVEIISDHTEATKVWSRETIFSDIASCDIGIIPFPTGLIFEDNRGFQPLAKDINRVTLLQAAGLPVIAAPLPAYLKYIRNGVDGLIADGPDEFEACVSLLEQNREASRAMANLGWLRAWSTASSPFTGNRWSQLLKKLAAKI